MPTFTYVVKDAAGRTHTGSLETDSRRSLAEQLWKQDLVVLSIEERAPRRASFTTRLSFVNPQQLVLFVRQLAAMVESGIPILGALDVLAEQVEDRAFQTILKRVRDEVEGGSSLSESLSKHPGLFSELFVNMVKAGESSGRLDEILDRLATYLEKAEHLRRKVLASLLYPAMVSCLACAITAFLVLVVVPQFKEIFTTFGGQLPLPTRILLATSEGFRRFFLLEVLLVMAGLIGFRVFVATKTGRLWFDQTTLKLPVIGALLQKVAIARFARTLATLIRSGVPILTAMEIVAKTTGNTVVEAAILRARASVREGETIAEPLAESALFPPLVTRMVAVGEKTGQLERMLSKVAEFYESEVDAAVVGLTSLIEPVIIAVLGVVIGAIVIALFLPIFKLPQLINAS